MANGLALAIGLNAVDPQHYEGWSGPLTACESDANDMMAITRSQGFECTTLLTQKATRERVIKAISGAAQNLKAGDLFVLSYSGHGGQLPDLNGDETDQMDETWCLHDGELVDDELYTLWGKFEKGVRIFVLSDSCHSGSVTKELHYASTERAAQRRVFRAMPNEVALRVYQKNTSFYDPILKDRNIAKSRDAVKASVLLISGCQDNQLSSDGLFNGLFTGTMKSVWNGGTFKGSYRKFHNAIGRKMPPDQTPRITIVGASDPKFAAATPFRI